MEPIRNLHFTQLNFVLEQYLHVTGTQESSKESTERVCVCMCARVRTCVSEPRVGETIMFVCERKPSGVVVCETKASRGETT